MAITNKFLCYQTNNAFLSDLNNNQISDESIVFVVDKHFIYTHGNYFYGDLKADDLNDTEYVIANALVDLDSRIKNIISNNQELESAINSDIEDINDSIEGIEGDIEELDQSIEGLDNTKADVEDSVEYIVGTQVNSTNSWTGVTKSSSLYDGKKIIYWLPASNELITTSNTYVTLSITLLSGNGNTVSSNVLIDPNTIFNKEVPADTPIPLVYKNNSWYLLRDLENNATTTTPGLMSSEDKTKLDSFDDESEYTKNETIEDIELTISAALSDLDRRLTILSGKVTLLEQATDNNLDVISTALNDIVSDINDIKSQLNS